MAPEPSPKRLRAIAPPHRAPELIYDVIAEILLRLPPDEPAFLIRAAAVCKLWRRLVSDPEFLRRYRRFYRTPPLLGFFYDFLSVKPYPRFVPTTAVARPFPQLDVNCGAWTYDCRHGRVLRHMERSKFIVWDTVTGERQELSNPDISDDCYDAAVLCARSGRCDHLHCEGGPFLIVFVGYDNKEEIMRPCIYSSESGTWSLPASIQLADVDSFVEPNRGALVGDGIYFILADSNKILRYHLHAHCLSVIDPPDVYYQNCVLMGNDETGSLGLAGIKGSSLYLWLKMVKPEEIEGWARYRVIKLDKLIIHVGNLSHLPRVIGFAEGVDVIFISSYAGVFVMELKTERVRMVCWGTSYNAALPFMSFSPLDCTSSKMSLPA